MADRIDTVVVGAGQAGLAASRVLSRHGVDHVVLERGRVAERWRTGRWDSFALVTPNWTLRLPDFPYRGDDPDGFLGRDAIVEHLDAYAAFVDPPIRSGCAVTRLGPGRAGGRFRVDTSDGPLEARNVIIATGTFQRPWVPSVADGSPPGVPRLHVKDYVWPDALPPGGVLIVGSGQSGAQIAWELARAGRDVHLSVGAVTRMPRRYRGHDVFWWADRSGQLQRPVDALDDPEETRRPAPLLSGAHGGSDLDLRVLARDGVRLYGRLERFEGTTARFAPTLRASLQEMDRSVAAWTAEIDAYVRAAGIDAPPPEPIPAPGSHDDPPSPEALDLERTGIGSIVWATGYAFDFGWIDLPVLDDRGQPRQRRGVTPVPGVYVLGLHWLHTLGSGLFYGVGDDAEHVVRVLAADRA